MLADHDTNRILHAELPAARREPRYSVTRPNATAVTLVSSNASGVDHIAHGTLADISRTGLRSALPNNIPVGTHVRLQLSVPEAYLDLICEGVIRWAQPRDHDSWWIGCFLDQKLEDSVIEALAQADVINRRSDERFAIRVPAEAKGELSGELVSVKLVNYSGGGLCIETDDPSLNANGRLLLIFNRDQDNETRVTLRSVWSEQGNGVIRIGCSYLSNNGFERVRSVVEPDREDDPNPMAQFARAKRGISTIIVYAVVMLATLQLVDFCSFAFPNQYQVVRRTVTTVTWPVQQTVGKPLSDGLKKCLKFVRPATSDDDADAMDRDAV